MRSKGSERMGFLKPPVHFLTVFSPEGVER